MQPSPSSTAHGGHVWQRDRLRLVVSRVSSCDVIEVHGEVDAYNASAITECVVAHLDDYCQSPYSTSVAVDFFGTSGLFGAAQAKCRMRPSVVCDWLFVPAPRVKRVLRICDPEAALPVTDSARRQDWPVLDSSRHLQLM